MPHSLEFSVVVPVHNESGNVEKLISEIAAALDGRAYEMVFVDDASTDDTRAILAELKTRFPALRVLGHRKNAGNRGRFALVCSQRVRLWLALWTVMARTTRLIFPISTGC